MNNASLHPLQMTLWPGLWSHCSVCGRQGNEEELDACVECDCLCCGQCALTEYRNFRLYDGNVEIVSVCFVCCGFVPGREGSNEVGVS